MVWQHLSPEVTGGVLNSAVYTLQWMRLMMIWCGMAVKRMEMCGVGVSNIKALTAKIGTVTPL
jgi:hypothetical protein